MSAQQTVAVWDLPVRIFHWVVVILVPLNFWWFEGGGWAHECAGYAIAALLVARIMWGFLGSHNARFVNFFPTLARLRRHHDQLRTRNFDVSEGHNPIGALMILFLLSLLILIVVSGWMQDLDRFWGEDWVQQLHKYAANALMMTVVIHLIGVIVMSRFTRLHLIRTMITGTRRVASEPTTNSSK